MTIGKAKRGYRRYCCSRRWFVFCKIALWSSIFLSVCAMSQWVMNNPCLTSSTDRDRLAYMVKAFSLIMTDLNITHWIDYGTLLGALRYEHIIPWDHDADVSFDRRFVFLLHNGGVAQQIAKKKYNMFLNAAVIVYEGMQTDIYSWRKVPANGGFIYTKASNRASNLIEAKFNDFNASYLDNPVLIPFAGGYVRVPSPPLEFARQRYPTSLNRSIPFKLSCYLPWNLPRWLFQHRPRSKHT